MSEEKKESWGVFRRDGASCAANRTETLVGTPYEDAEKANEEASRLRMIDAAGVGPIGSYYVRKV